MVNNLGRILRERGLTYQGLGQLVGNVRDGEGVSEATLTKIVKYDHVPREETQRVIAEALGLEIEEIWPIDK